MKQRCIHTLFFCLVAVVSCRETSIEVPKVEEQYGYNVSITDIPGVRTDNEVITPGGITFTVDDGDYVDYELRYSIDNGEEKHISKIWIGETRTLLMDDKTYGPHSFHGVLRRSDGKGNEYEFLRTVYMRSPEISIVSAKSISWEEQELGVEPITLYQNNKSSVVLDFLPKNAYYDIKSNVTGNAIEILGEGFEDGLYVVHLSAQMPGSACLSIVILNGDLTQTIEQEYRVEYDEEKAYYLDYSAGIETVYYGETSVLSLTAFSGIPDGGYSISVYIDYELVFREDSFLLTDRIITDGISFDLGVFPVGKHECQVIVSREDKQKDYKKTVSFEVLPRPIESLSIQRLLSDFEYTPDSDVDIALNSYTGYKINIEPSNVIVYDISFTVTNPEVAVCHYPDDGDIFYLGGLKTGTSELIIKINGVFEYRFNLIASSSVTFSPAVDNTDLYLTTISLDNSIMFDKVEIMIRYHGFCRYYRTQQFNGIWENKEECAYTEQKTMSYTVDNLKISDFATGKVFSDIKAIVSQITSMTVRGSIYDPLTSRVNYTMHNFEFVVDNYDITVSIDEPELRSLINLTTNDWKTTIHWN